jgi:hypothetical protein
MFGAGVVLSAAELAQSAGQPGTGLLLLALFASFASLARDWSRGSSRRAADSQALPNEAPHGGMIPFSPLLRVSS